MYETGSKCVKDQVHHKQSFNTFVKPNHRLNISQDEALWSSTYVSRYCSRFYAVSKEPLFAVGIYCCVNHHSKLKVAWLCKKHIIIWNK